MADDVIPLRGRKGAMVLAQADKETLILTFRRRGLSFSQISEQLAKENPPIVMTTQAVAQFVKRRLDHHNREMAETVDELRALENERLDELMAAWGPAARQGDPKAANVMLKIMDQRAKLNGLNAAQRHEHSLNGSVLHELGIDADEIARGREAFAASFQDMDLEDVVDVTPVELESGD